MPAIRDGQSLFGVDIWIVYLDRCTRLLLSQSSAHIGYPLAFSPHFDACNADLERLRVGEELERCTLFAAALRDWESGGTIITLDASLGIEGYLDWIHEEFRDRLQLSVVSFLMFCILFSPLLAASVITDI